MEKFKLLVWIIGFFTLLGLAIPSSSAVAPSGGTCLQYSYSRSACTAQRSCEWSTYGGGSCNVISCGGYNRADCQRLGCTWTPTPAGGYCGGLPRAPPVPNVPKFEVVCDDDLAPLQLVVGQQNPDLSIDCRVSLTEDISFERGIYLKFSIRDTPTVAGVVGDPRVEIKNLRLGSEILGNHEVRGSMHYFSITKSKNRDQMIKSYDPLVHFKVTYSDDKVEQSNPRGTPITITPSVTGRVTADALEADGDRALPPIKRVTKEIKIPVINAPLQLDLNCPDRGMEVSNSVTCSVRMKGYLKNDQNTLKINPSEIGGLEFENPVFVAANGFGITRNGGIASTQAGRLIAEWETIANLQARAVEPGEATVSIRGCWLKEQNTDCLGEDLTDLTSDTITIGGNAPSLLVECPQTSAVDSDVTCALRLQLSGQQAFTSADFRFRPGDGLSLKDRYFVLGSAELARQMSVEILNRGYIRVTNNGARITPGMLFANLHLRANSAAGDREVIVDYTPANGDLQTLTKTVTIAPADLPCEGLSQAVCQRQDARCDWVANAQGKAAPARAGTPSPPRVGEAGRCITPLSSPSLSIVCPQPVVANTDLDCELRLSGGVRAGSLRVVPSAENPDSVEGRTPLFSPARGVTLAQGELRFGSTMVLELPRQVINTNVDNLVVGTLHLRPTREGGAEISARYWYTGMAPQDAQFTFSVSPGAAPEAQAPPTVTLECPNRVGPDEILTCDVMLDGTITQVGMSGVIMAGNKFRAPSATFARVNPRGGRQSFNARTGAFSLDLSNGKTYNDEKIATYTVRTLQTTPGSSDLRLRYSANGLPEATVRESVTLTDANPQLTLECFPLAANPGDSVTCTVGLAREYGTSNPHFFANLNLQGTGLRFDNGACYQTAGQPCAVPSVAAAAGRGGTIAIVMAGVNRDESKRTIAAGNFLTLSFTAQTAGTHELSLLVGGSSVPFIAPVANPSITIGGARASPPARGRGAPAALGGTCLEKGVADATGGFTCELQPNGALVWKISPGAGCVVSEDCTPRHSCVARTRTCEPTGTPRPAPPRGGYEFSVQKTACEGTLSCSAGTSAVCSYVPEIAGDNEIVRKKCCPQSTDCVKGSGDSASCVTQHTIHSGYAYLVCGTNNDWDSCGPAEDARFNKHHDDLSDDRTKRCEVVDGQGSWVDVEVQLPESPVGLHGDIDGNTRVEIADAILLARSVLGIVDQEFTVLEADLNLDNTVDINDAILLAQFALGIVDSLGGGN